MPVLRAASFVEVITPTALGRISRYHLGIMSVRKSRCHAAGVAASALLSPTALAQSSAGAQPGSDWHWAVVAAVVVVLFAASAMWLLRLRSSLRELQLQNRELQQSHGDLLRLNAGLERDISDRRAAEAAREATLAGAERLVRQHTALLSRMNHELRTPLNGVLYFANVLQLDSPLTERQRRGLRTIEESGQLLLALVNDIVELARLDAGKLELAAIDVGLMVFLERLANTVRVKAEAKGLLLSLRVAPGLPVAVQVDETRLHQVLLNLLTNAVKFTDRGQVTLDVKSSHTAAHSDGGKSSVRLRFEVSDSGIGMSAAQLARLFEPYEQVGEVKERGSGSGLGLAISRRLVRLMGSDIHVSSRPGEGSAFWFEVDTPLVSVGVAARAASDGPSRGLGQARPASTERVEAEDVRHVAPPSAEMMVLRELARIGNMRTIRERADYLKSLDPRYGPFAEQLATLADQCQSKAIAHLVEAYSDDRGMS
jgi:signal transduction histidine kinase